MVEKKKIRVLALHGGGSNSNILRGATSMLRRQLGEDVEWDYLDGSTEYNNEGACCKHGEFRVMGMVANFTEVEMALAKGEPMKGWYVSTCSADSSDARHWLEKFCDTSVEYSYDGQAEKHAERVLEHIASKGPFDVLFSFSQASAIILLAAGLARERGMAIPWKLSVCFSPMPVRDKRFEQLLKAPLDHSAVFCFGGCPDWSYAYARYVCPVQECCTEPTLLVHGEGHGFPQKKSLASEYYSKLAVEMWRRCGGTIWEVIGGGGTGGIIVRSELGLQSKQEQNKLAHGALLLELDLVGERLHYRLLQGTGPLSGWVSVALKAKPLLVRFEADGNRDSAPSDRSEAIEALAVLAR